jgi:NADH-quinone oxidoreductase subunit N
MNLIIFSGLLGVVMMFSGLFIKNKRTISYIAIAAIAFLFLANTCELRSEAAWLNVNVKGMLNPQKYGLLINSILLLAGFFYFALSGKEVEKVGSHVADYYALIFFIFAGIGIATSYTNLLMLFIGIEIISIPLYILTGADKKNLKSNEASLKYFLMGAFSTGIMLMGIALVYGATGSFMIEKIVSELPYQSVVFGGVIAGLLLLLVSMSFKVSAAPFHFWTPDVYDGSPTVFTSFMATIVKVAAFVAFIRLFEGSYGVMKGKWQLVIAILIASTLLIGNITAVFQQSVKRMLAYSSISQAGFMLFALFAFNNQAQEGIVLYAAAYCFATIGIFAVLAKMDDYTYEGFNGFAKKQPMLAALLTVFVLSLAGIPLTAGFFSKYFMISAALATGGKYLWLIVLAMLCAAISVYYYFRIIQAMYFKKGEADSFQLDISGAFKVGLFVLAVFVIVLGINPQMLLQYFYF